MAGIIDPEGLFNGDRFELVSDSTRFAWPYLWLASNSCGRIELNYRKIVGRAFSRFRSVPTEPEFWNWIEELQQAYLLFTYQASGTVWGQWDTSEKFLPRHKLTADQKSPAPPHEEFLAWKDQYIRDKQQRNSAKPITVTDFGKGSEGSPHSCANSSEKFLPRVGVGVGVGKNICPSPNGAARASELPSIDDPPFGTGEPGGLFPDDAPAAADLFDENGNGNSRRPSERLRQRWFNEEFWPEYPRKVKKVRAEKAFLKAAGSADQKDRIMAALRRQREHLLQDGPKFCPYASKWLEDRQFEDDSDAAGAADVAPSSYLPAEDDE